MLKPEALICLLSLMCFSLWEICKCGGRVCLQKEMKDSWNHTQKLEFYSLCVALLMQC